MFMSKTCDKSTTKILINQKGYIIYLRDLETVYWCKRKRGSEIFCFLLRVVVQLLRNDRTKVKLKLRVGLINEMEIIR